MLLRSSVKGTIGHVTDSVLVGRDSNRDPNRFQENSIHDSNNNDSYNNVEGFNNLGDGSLSHISDVAQSAAIFTSNLSLLITY